MLPADADRELPASAVVSGSKDSQPSGEQLELAARCCVVEIFSSHYERLSQYVDVLTSRGVDWGLLGPREPERIWSRHIVNCAAIAELVPSEASLIDVGSGAGLPGLVIAVLRPDLRITLLEPLLRRAEFLSLTIAELGLEERVRVVRERAEEHQFCYAVVTARAVARLPKLVNLVEPLMAEAGELLALKGQSVHDELDEAAALLDSRHLSAEVLSVTRSPVLEAATVLRLRRID